MPELDGWKTLEEIRAVTDTPVIMVTGQDSELERVRGLRGGADDYVGKPYSGPELVARIKAVLRRTKETTVRDVIDDGVVRVDFQSSQVSVRGEPVVLTPLESRLLVAFVEHPGQTLSQRQLVDLVWDGAPTGASEVRLYVRYLRMKIERDPARPELIETLRGFGYRYRRP
jgi:DNA-binding response OmpR family regulator